MQAHGTGHIVNIGSVLSAIPYQGDRWLISEGA
jgi:short-subunit dehydrogenase